MSNFRQDIEAAAEDEPIEAFMFVAFPWGCDDARYEPAKAREGELLTWDEAASLCDFQYDTGYGSQECPDIWAWTPTRVMFVHEYDGSTALDWAPRNPPAPVAIEAAAQTGAAA